MKKIGQPVERRAIRTSFLIGLIVLVAGIALILRRDPPADPQNAHAVGADEMPPASDETVTLTESAGGETREPAGNPKPAAGTFTARLGAGLDAIDAETDPIRREELLLSFLGGITADQIPATLAALQAYDLSESARDVTLRLVRRWADTDPKAAAAFASQMTDGPARADSLDQVAIAWSGREFTEAAAWAQRLSDIGERHQALKMVAYETIRTEPVEALRLATELPDGPSRSRLLRQAASEWAAQEPADALQWAQQIPAGTVREQVLAGVAVAWAERDPIAAATVAATELAEGNVQRDAVVNIAQQWVQGAPEDAAAWVGQFPDSQLKLAAVESITTIWSLTDPMRAQQWKSNLQPVMPSDSLP